MSSFVEWLRGFLSRRGLTRPSGAMLFSYRATRSEYFELRGLFAAQLEQLRGAPWAPGSAAECACFVLYAAEWWRREYNGGPWRWTHILSSFGQPFLIDVLDRTWAVERGLKAWGHRPGGQGKKYLGAIVAQGGLPLQLVARGDGSITRLLIRAMRQAQLYGWDSNRLESFFEAHQLELVQHLRDEDIYRLLASVVVTVQALRHECQLAGVASPVELLDRRQPNWRERFPISVDDNTAEPLLVGLVKEAAKEYASVTSFPVVATRSLHLDDDGETYWLTMTAEMPGSITLAALSSTIGLSSDLLPQAFSIDLMGRERVLLGEGRQLLGGGEASAVLSGGMRRIQGDAALTEHLLVLRCMGEDLHPPVEVPGAYALDAAQPWVFAARDIGLVLIAVGGCRAPEDTCLVAVPDGFEILAEGDGSNVDLKGVTGGITEPRWIYEVRGAARLTGLGTRFLVRTGQATDTGGQLLWRGTRAPYRSRSMSVHLGVPLLCRLAPDGSLTQVPARSIEWAMPGRAGELIDQPRHHRGPIDAWLVEDGERQRRFRMVLLPPEAKLRFRSGATECEGSIEFHAWGIESIDVPRELSARTDPLTNGLKLELRAEGRPPATIPAEVCWPGSPYALRLDLPFPATGGQFTTAEGRVFPAGQTMPIRELPGVRVQVFDRNPDAPKRYSLTAELSGQGAGSSVGRLHVEHFIPIDKQGFGELRLLEVESSFLGLLCQSSQLDARLELKLLAGGAAIAKLAITRYDADLEPNRQSQEMAISAACYARLTGDELHRISLRALPLLIANAEEVELKQSRSEGTPTGRWSVGCLSADQGPWMVYPSSTSTLQLRPTLYAGFAIGAAAPRTTKLCPLGEAMAIADGVDRASAIGLVVADMAQDLDHASWLLIIRQYQVLSHLPLSTFDYWRALAGSMPSSLAVLLKLSHDIQALVKRMREELGVVWELMPRSTLAEGLGRLQQSWAKQLDAEPENSVVRSLSEQVFRMIGGADPLLDDIIELVLFQAGFNRTDKLTRLIAPFSTGARPLVASLWHGENSMLQRFLLRTHAEDRVWPHFELAKALIQLLQEARPDAASKLFELCGKDLVWMPTAGQAGPYAKNVKADVANAPVLAGLASQLLSADSPWWSALQLAQLRQIRNFDPAWFELGCRTGLLLALMAEEQLAKPTSAAERAKAPAGYQSQPQAAARTVLRVPRTSGSA